MTEVAPTPKTTYIPLFNTQIMKQMAYILIIIGILTLSTGIYFLCRPSSSAPSHQNTPASDTTLVINNICETHVTNNTIINDNLTAKERKGRQFEEWVVSQFPKAHYTIKEWRADRFKDGTYAESCRYPDLEIQLHLKDFAETFAVECKYLSRIPEKYEWASQEKIDIYNKYAKERDIPTFVIFGIGGTPSSPSEVFIAPLQDLQSPTLTTKRLRTFHSHDLTRSFYYYAKENTLL